jgi:uncharacterized membrane protein
MEPMLVLLGVLLVVAGPLPVVLASALGLTSIAGQTQTIRPIITPLAANFNLAPAALLDLDDRFAVIRAQAPTALVLLAVNTVLMNVLVFPAHP